ncbi:MAG: DNA replication and repair protein RecF [Bacteroidia bacterium]|nr:DNA replication and repair protein RecF [Bacteroidia bacterium]
MGGQNSAWIGPNASGKTSVLEAIQKVAILRGFGKEEELLQWGASAYRLRAHLADGIVEVLYEKGKGTRVLWEGVPIEPLHHWIGRLPVVSLKPSDISWIESGAAERRRWADRLLSQSSPLYMEALSRYQRALSQRNALLALTETTPSQIEAWNHVLEQEGIQIQLFRYRLVEHLYPLLQEFYSGFGPEKVALTYRYSVEPALEDWRKAWQRVYAEERRRGYTLIGPHLEDFLLLLDGRPARGYASEGQKKSLLIALKWAEVAHLQRYGSPPLLLLDDIGEKLDEHRLQAVGRLSQLASQTFITDTDENRVRRAFPEIEILSTFP